jgi:hypothetical protein
VQRDPCRDLLSKWYSKVYNYCFVIRMVTRNSLLLDGILNAEFNAFLSKLRVELHFSLDEFSGIGNANFNSSSNSALSMTRCIVSTVHSTNENEKKCT